MDRNDANNKNVEDKIKLKKKSLRGKRRYITLLKCAAE